MGWSFRSIMGVAFAASTLAFTEPSAANQLHFIKIASGGTGGTYFPIAGLIGTVISNPPGARSCEQGGNCGMPNLSATAVSTGGSVANVDALLKDKYETAISQSDVAYWSYNGKGPFRTRKPNQKLCALTSLYKEDVHLMGTKDKDIASVSDLKGKRVAVGKPDSGMLLTSQLLVRAFGMQEGKDFKAIYSDFKSAPNYLAQGLIDSFVTTVGYPSKAIASMMNQGKVELIPITGSGRDKMIKSAPFYSPSSIPAGTYPNQASTIETVGTSALFISRTNLSADLHYGIVKAMWANKRARNLFDKGHARGVDINVKTVFDGIAIPLCVGAQKFYKEAGFLK